MKTMARHDNKNPVVKEPVSPINTLDGDTLYFKKAIVAPAVVNEIIE